MLAFIAKRTLSMFPAIVVVCAGPRMSLGAAPGVTPCLYEDGVGCVGASMPSVLTSRGFESLSGDEIVFGIK